MDFLIGFAGGFLMLTGILGVLIYVGCHQQPPEDFWES